MNPPSEDIKDMLVDAGIGTFGADLFISQMPDTPNACVGLYDTGGYQPEANYVYDRPTVMARIRGDIGGYINAYGKAEDIKGELHGLTNETWNSTRYVQILCQSDIMFLGYDDNNRPLLSINFAIHRTE